MKEKKGKPVKVKIKGKWVGVKKFFKSKLDELTQQKKFYKDFLESLEEYEE